MAEAEAATAECGFGVGFGAGADNALLAVGGPFVGRITAGFCQLLANPVLPIIFVTLSGSHFTRGNTQIGFIIQWRGPFG
jgi:hypothetical protein